MNPEFNRKKDLVKKLKEDDTSYMETSNNRNPLKEKLSKNLFRIAIITAVVIVVLILLSNVIGGNKTYSEIENIMVNASGKYFSEHSASLPKVTSATVEVSMQKLINEGYMKEIAKYKRGANCSGKVVVENNDDKYIYVAYLDCGDSYKTTEFYRKLTDSKNIVNSGNGLYINGGAYIYRGDNVNNYVLINDNLWRAVEVDSNNQVVLIKQDKVSSESISFDDRYNNEKGNIVGINDFNVSRIKDYYNDLYLDKIEDVKLFDDNIKSHLTSHKYCIGKRSEEDTTIDGSAECSILSDDMKIGGLALYEYMRASLDSNCTTSVSESCQNYNYLATEDMSWWTVTADSTNTYKAYYVSTFGEVSLTNAINKKKIRPVVYLNSRTMYESGDGTLNDPYKIK